MLGPCRFANRCQNYSHQNSQEHKTSASHSISSIFPTYPQNFNHPSQGLINQYAKNKKTNIYETESGIGAAARQLDKPRNRVVAKDLDLLYLAADWSFLSTADHLEAP